MNKNNYKKNLKEEMMNKNINMNKMKWNRFNQLINKKKILDYNKNNKLLKLYLKNIQKSSIKNRT